MVSKMTVINNPTGLHLRPAGLLCKTAIEFKSKISLGYKDNYVNAKSVLGVLGACIKTGDQVDIRCEGEDEEKALETIITLIDNGLGEHID